MVGDVGGRWRVWAYELGVEFGQARLPVVVEDEHCVDHLAHIIFTWTSRIWFGVSVCNAFVHLIHLISIHIPTTCASSRTTRADESQ